MTTRLAVPAFVLVFGCGDPAKAPREVADTPANKPVVATLPDISDPYARPPGGSTSPVIAMNRGTPPPASERPGSGSPTTIPAATRTANGYAIRFPTGSPVPTPAIHGTRLIVSGGFNSREIYAYEAKSGGSAWGKTLTDDGPSNPVCEGETCVFNSESCTTFAVDARTGNVKWAWWLGDPQTSSPTIANGLVFASYPSHAGYYGDPAAKQPAGTHVIAAFDLATGKPVWRKWLDADVMSAPVAVDSFVYLTTFAGTVMKLDQKTGDIRYAIAMRATSAPVVLRAGGRESLHVTRRVEERPDETKEAIVRADLGDTRLAFRARAKPAPYLDPNIQRGTEYAKVAQVDDSENGFASVPAAAGATGALGTVGVGSVSTMQRFQGSRVLLAGGMVYSTMGDEVLAVDGETGEIKWRHALPGDIKKAGGHLGTAPLIAGGEIVIATLGGDVLRLDAKTGKRVATYTTSAPLRSQPAVHDGWIYLGTEDGRLIAIDTGVRTLTGWPTWGGDNGRTAVRS
jgi:outer membrane protein assembly factor BamB